MVLFGIDIFLTFSAMAINSDFVLWWTHAIKFKDRDYDPGAQVSRVVFRRFILCRPKTHIKSHDEKKSQQEKKSQHITRRVNKMALIWFVDKSPRSRKPIQVEIQLNLPNLKLKH